MLALPPRLITGPPMREPVVLDKDLERVPIFCMSPRGAGESSPLGHIEEVPESP